MKYDVKDVVSDIENASKQFFVCALVETNYARPIMKIEPCMVTAVLNEECKINSSKEIKSKDKILLVKTALKTGKLNYDKLIEPFEKKSGKYHCIDIFDNFEECKQHYSKLI